MPAGFLGQYLLEKGVISAESLLKAVQLQETTNLKLGALAVVSGALTAQQAEQINATQRRTDQPFGELAVMMGYLSYPKLQELLAKQKSAHVLIGEALVRVGGLTRDALERELAAYKAEQQAQAPKPSHLPATVPHGRELALLVDLTIKMLRRCANIVSRPAKVSVDPKRTESAFLEAIIPFKGQLEGRYGLRVPRTLAERITKGMIGEVPKADAELVDAVREFGNVVAGTVVAKLSAEGLVVEIFPPEHSMPAPPREVAPGTRLARATVDTVYGTLVVFFESPRDPADRTET
jgi:CheY-specific phosphatase CheX